MSADVVDGTTVFRVNDRTQKSNRTNGEEEEEYVVQLRRLFYFVKRRKLSRVDGGFELR